MSNSIQPISFCTTCDAAPGDCNHAGARYLAEIRYEQTEHGWKVPDNERTRWDSPKWLASTGGWATAARSPVEAEPIPIGDILTSLEGIIFLSDEIRTMLHDSYDKNPGQTTLLVQNVKQSAGTLNNPAGLLVKRLRQLLA